MKIERQLQGTLNTVFTELIKERGLEKKIEPYSVQEEHRADITLKRKKGKTIFFIELKDPTANDGKSLFDGNVLMREVGRAQKHDIQYFGNCNFLGCAFFDKDKIYDKVSVTEGFFTLSDIKRLSDNYVANKDIENKLRSIAEFYLDRALEIIEKKPITFSPLDELFIFKIRKLIEVFGHPISEEVWDKYKRDKKFEKEIQRYTQSQLWNKPSTFDEIENLSHIALLMLISKLIFYKAYVDNQTWHELHPMKVDSGITDPEELEKAVWHYFETFKEITGNFELLIGERADIVFQIPFVSDAVIDLVKDVLDTGDHYNFSEIPFDIIGRIFEELIREDERHKLGQYFTPPYVIDLINSFAIHKFNDKVFDPSCGSGTFLVRAYERKKQLSKEEDRGVRHEVLLNEIYGNDLSGYPAYLSMLNLAIRNTRKPSYPRISNKDFFAITSTLSVPLHNQEGNLEKKPLPKFDAIIGNPPYTRQEDIGTMKGTQTKDQIQELIRKECGFQPSARTSIYAYFFYHANVFLKDKGYLAFIVQNSWLDTEYGIDLQGYLTRNYEIMAIMDSEIERFFPSASVNTSIVIARKQSNEDIRKSNSVKFVYFKKPLVTVIQKYKGADNLRDLIESISQNEVNEYFNLNILKQDVLHLHTKWGQFLRAPKVYTDILERSRGKFMPLKTVAKIKFGIKTGCNDFFLLKDITESSHDRQLSAVINNSEEFQTIRQAKAQNLRLVENGYNELWLIESQFLVPVLTSPKDVNLYNIENSDLKFFILTLHSEKKELRKKYKYAFSYILSGEKKNINSITSLASRKIWYDIGARKVPNMSFNYIISEYGRTFWGNVFTNNNFHNIYAQDNAKSIWLYMNSSISWLIQQLVMRNNLGEGAGKIEAYDLANFPIVNMNLEKLNIDLGATKNYKEEFGDLVSLKSVNSERVKLDSAILEAIGYKKKGEREEVLLNLYKATYHLIEYRLQKAQSLKGIKIQRNRIEFNVYVDQLKAMLLEGKYSARNTLTFGKQVEKLVHDITSEKKLQKKIFDTYWKERFGETYNEKQLANKDQLTFDF